MIAVRRMRRPGDQTGHAHQGQGPGGGRCVEEPLHGAPIRTAQRGADEEGGRKHAARAACAKRHGGGHELRQGECEEKGRGAGGHDAKIEALVPATPEVRAEDDIEEADDERAQRYLGPGCPQSGEEILYPPHAPGVQDRDGASEDAEAHVKKKKLPGRFHAEFRRQRQHRVIAEHRAPHRRGENTRHNEGTQCHPAGRAQDLFDAEDHAGDGGVECRRYPRRGPAPHQRAQAVRRRPQPASDSRSGRRSEHDDRPLSAHGSPGPDDDRRREALYQNR